MSPPYRVPIELEEAEVEGPVSWRRTSTRVLGALAALTHARGATEPSVSPTSGRAIDREVRTLPPCAAGFAAFASGDLDRARALFSTWLEDAAVLLVGDRDRCEALLALATIASLQRRHADADPHLRQAFALGLPRGRALPLSLVLFTARALFDLDRNDLAAALLSERREKDATLQRLRSELALAGNELARAQILAGEALELDGGSKVGRAESRVLVARIHLRAGRVEAAERALALALAGFADEHSIVEAEAFALVATLFAARGDFPRAKRAIAEGARGVSPSIARLPFLLLGSRVLHAAGESALASTWDGWIASIRRPVEPESERHRVSAPVTLR